MMAAYSCYDVAFQIREDATESYWLRARLCQMVQQGIEICYKAVLEHKVKGFPHTHDLVTLEKTVLENNISTPLFEPQIIVYLNSHAGPFQYDNLVEAPSEKSMDKILDHCQKAYDWAEEITGFNPKDYTIPIIDL